MKKFKEIIVIFIPLILGSIVGLLIGNDTYNIVIKPPLSPPAIIFPIVWSILYLLMGISYYIIYHDKEVNKIYYIQLIVNLSWPILFFKLKWYLISVLWIILLIILVINMIIIFSKRKKIAGTMNLPYLIWLLFAFYLNLGVYILN